MSTQLADDGRVLLLTSLPAKTFVGLDLLSFNSSPNFQGISAIPLGIHFIYTGTDASLSIRHGQWLILTPSTPVISSLEWNTNTESLDAVDIDAATIRSTSRRGFVDYGSLQDATSELAAREAADSTRRQSSTLRLSNDRITEVAEDEAKEDEEEDEEDPAESTDWPSLTSYISPSLLTRILSTEWVVSSISSAPSDTETIPGLSHLGESSSFGNDDSSNPMHQLPLNLLPINLKQTWADEDIGRTRTDRARDRSWYLGQLISRASERPGTETVTDTDTDMNVDKSNNALGAREVLGELQFCFLMVLTLANYSCLEQWKRLLSVFFTCRDAALGEAEAYFVEMLKVVRMQIRHVEDVEGGLFELRDEMASSWLRALWGRFREMVVDDDSENDRERPSSSGALRREINALQTLFEDRYGWQSDRDVLRRGMLELEDGERVEVSMKGVDEDEETGEYAPVIVEM